MAESMKTIGISQEKICQSCKFWKQSDNHPRPWGNCSNQEVIKRVDEDPSTNAFSPDFDFGCRF